jgi:AcrR family transcriptional regulator
MTSEKLDAGSRAVDGPDAFRERIIAASTELIEEQGLSSLSMREVARRAGVSHQAPYYYFADREAILGAIAEQGFRMLGEYVVRSAPEGVGCERAAVIAAGRAYLEFALEHRAHFRVMFRPELVSAERNPNVLGEGVRACDQFYQIVCRAVEAGMPARPSVDALFLLCWSVGHGLACLVLDGPLDKVMPHVDRKAQLRDVLTQFEHLLNASAGAVPARVDQDAPPAPRRTPRADKKQLSTRKSAKRTR